MGTNYLAPTWRQPENFNKDRLSNYSINFGGSDYIGCGTDLFTGSNISSISISVWVKTTTGSANAIISKDLTSTGNRNFLLQLSGNDLYWQTSVDGNILQPITTSVNLLDGEWHHIVATYEAGSTSGTAEKKIYVDGQVEATDPAATLNNIVNTPSVPIEIARRGDDTRYYSGEISQVSIFDYALSTDQVTYLNNLGNPLIISGAEPIAYWPLGDNSNPTATAGYPNIVSSADSVFDFDGTDYIDTPEIDLQTTNTISLWYNRSVSGTDVLVGQGTAWYDYTIRLATDGGIKYADKFTSPIIDFQSAATKALASPLNKWINIIIVRTGTTANCWVNGINNDGAQTFGAGTQDGTVFNRFGMAGDGTSFGFNGKLSNIAAWNSDQSANIDIIYNNGMPLLELSEMPQKDNLLAWYKLNQSAVLTPGVPTNWTITKIGNPNYSGSNDGCYAGTSGTSPYNSGLVWHDNNSGATVGSDYFQWNSPIIYTSGSNIVLSSSGGSYNGQFGGGSQAILEYNIDDGSWVNWHTQTNPTTGSSTTFTIPSTGNLTVSNNIKIRIKGVDFGSISSYLKINDINATGGTSSYNESFTNATRYGFSGGSETQPPATFSADHWDIPDNRSAYPQSFDFNGSTDYIGVPNNTNLQITNNLTLSCWVNADNVSATNSIIDKFYDGTDRSYLLRIAATRVKLYLGNTDGSSAPEYQSTATLSNNIWYHIATTFSSTDNEVKIYINGSLDSTHSKTDLISSNNQELRIGTGYNLLNYFTGKISNVQIFDTALPATGSNSIETLYNNGVPLPTASVEPSSLKAWYKLDNNDVWNPVLNQWEIIDYAN